MLLIDPFYISRSASPHSYRSRVLELLPRYIDVVARMSEKYKTRRVRTHEIFQQLLEKHDPDEFCPEPVHPYRSGHIVIAWHVLEALG